jgi:hypothetical protein
MTGAPPEPCSRACLWRLVRLSPSSTASLTVNPIFVQRIGEAGQQPRRQQRRTEQDKRAFPARSEGRREGRSLQPQGSRDARNKTREPGSIRGREGVAAAAPASSRDARNKTREPFRHPLGGSCGTRASGSRSEGLPRRGCWPRAARGREKARATSTLPEVRRAPRRAATRRSGGGSARSAAGGRRRAGSRREGAQGQLGERTQA